MRSGISASCGRRSSIPPSTAPPGVTVIAPAWAFGWCRARAGCAWVFTEAALELHRGHARVPGAAAGDLGHAAALARDDRGAVDWLIACPRSRSRSATRRRCSCSATCSPSTAPTSSACPRLRKPKQSRCGSSRTAWIRRPRCTRWPGRRSPTRCRSSTCAWTFGRPTSPRSTYINRLLIRRAMQLLDPQPGERIADLFCGLGNFPAPADGASRGATHRRRRQ